MKDFRKALSEGDEFVVTWELVPGRGYAERGIQNVEAALKNAAAADFIHAITITDNAGGMPALYPGIFGIQEMLRENHKVNVIVHFSCKDLNRNGLESQAMALSKCNIHNLLVLSGDYPVAGFAGQPKPVFDLDAVTAICYLKQMNKGLEVKSGSKTKYLTPTDFYIGATASPFKWEEASLQMQYCKLQKKINAGADYLITQLGFDSRKFIEFYQYVRYILKSTIPVMGSVYVLTAGAADYMCRGLVPGCYMSKQFLGLLKEEAQAPDRGKQTALARAARQVAILKGLGYNGAHIEGLNISAEDIQSILSQAAERQPDWQDFLEEFTLAPAEPFYFFSWNGKSLQTGKETVAKSGESKPRSINDRLKDLLDFSNQGLNPQLKKRQRIYSPTFWFMLLFHKLFFVENTPGYKFFRAFCRIAEKKRSFYRFLSGFESIVKKLLFDCRSCDDCALFELHYLCPESQCPKSMRNGPCGGSRPGGKCEVRKDKECLWVRVYKRAKNRRELEKLKVIIAPRNWELYETSSWVNYFLKYDHSGLHICSVKHETDKELKN